MFLYTVKRDMWIVGCIGIQRNPSFLVYLNISEVMLYVCNRQEAVQIVNERKIDESSEIYMNYMRPEKEVSE